MCLEIAINPKKSGIAKGLNIWVFLFQMTSYRTFSVIKTKYSLKFFWGLRGLKASILGKNDASRIVVIGVFKSVMPRLLQDFQIYFINQILMLMCYLFWQA